MQMKFQKKTRFQKSLSPARFFRLGNFREARVTMNSMANKRYCFLELKQMHFCEAKKPNNRFESSIQLQFISADFKLHQELVGNIWI
jgi:hypothetical protein